MHDTIENIYAWVLVDSTTLLPKELHTQISFSSAMICLVLGIPLWSTALCWNSQGRGRHMSQNTREMLLTISIFFQCEQHFWPSLTFLRLIYWISLFTAFSPWFLVLFHFSLFSSHWWCPKSSVFPKTVVMETCWKCEEKGSDAFRLAALEIPSQSQSMTSTPVYL